MTIPNMELEEDLPLVINVGDAITLTAISPKGERILADAGTEIWIVKRIHMTPLVLNFEPGIMARPSQEPNSRYTWIKFNDEDLQIELCLN